MRKLIVLGVIGLLAQLIDGSLGMAYGVTSSTLLLAAGVAPAAASAAVHFSEIGTSLVSGFSHHKLGNVDWRTVSILALPGFVGALWALRGLAPTRLRLAGATARLCAGALGAFVYAFHCPELAAPFIGTWYVLGMAIPTAVGALLGPLALRWD